jgi:hypothetical protein
MDDLSVYENGDPQPVYSISLGMQEIPGSSLYLANIGLLKPLALQMAWLL